MPETIPVTHTGSLHRPAKPIEDEAERAADLAELITRQVDTGITSVSDGERYQTAFNSADDRLTGYGAGAPDAEWRPADWSEAAARQVAGISPAVRTPVNTGPVTYQPAMITARLNRLGDSLSRVPVHPEQVFVTAPGPGTLAMFGSTHYADRRDLLDAIAAAMRHEYQAITDAGYMLQIDEPAIFMEYSTFGYGMDLAELRGHAGLAIAAANRALTGIDPDLIRYHACWGNYPGRHDRNAPLSAVIGLLLGEENAPGIHAGTLLIEGANPAVRHQLRVFKDHPLPPGMRLGYGAVDVKSPIVEDPQVVADSLIQAGQLIGAGRVVAVPDCGFETLSGAVTVDEGTQWAKLAALAAGARLAGTVLTRT